MEIEEISSLLEETLENYRKEIKPLLENEVTRKEGEYQLYSPASGLYAILIHNEVISQFHYGLDLTSHCLRISKKIMNNKQLVTKDFDRFEVYLAQLILAIKSKNTYF